MLDKQTIVAQATPPGKGGVGVIRVSGPQVKIIAQAILSKPIRQPRMAILCDFLAESGDVLDQGIALFFPGPNSFTGEDVLELQGHGGPVVMDRLMQRVLGFVDTRPARPGEFSQRAFLNDKIDLTQAEAIADLIDAHSESAAKLAVRSLQGNFAKEIDEVLIQLIELRVFVEAAIDFPEEEIDFINDGQIANRIEGLLQQVQKVKSAAEQGLLLNEGMTVVIAGKPNAGKSSLLNALTGESSAIVTDIPGTTRDVLKEQIQIDGLPLHVIDTAGLRENADVVEQEGIKRAHDNINKADQVLLVADCNELESNLKFISQFKTLFPDAKITVIENKIDLLAEPSKHDYEGFNVISISAKTGEGLNQLKEHLKQSMGFEMNEESGMFLARRRHLNALEQTEKAVKRSLERLIKDKAGELVAEELRSAQQSLSEITGAFSTDDLLGEIFSSFCIGK